MRRSFGRSSMMLCALLVAAAPCAAQQPTSSAALVGAAWLREHIGDPGLRLLDIGKTAEQFEAGHLPGAQFVDWRVDLVDPGDPELFLVAPSDTIEALLSRLGVGNATTVVIYDNHGNRAAARMFWALRYYGHEDLRILDGGERAWRAAGFPITTERTAVAAESYRIAGTNEAYRSDKAFLQERARDPDLAVVDARQHDFYTGEVFGTPFLSEEPNRKAGHIAGARNAFWADHVNEDGTFKSVGELRALYRTLGIAPASTVVTYCHIGLQASTPWFVLKELLGYEDVRLYDGSMAEWANAEDTELVLGEN